jgi:hypothetical protein
MTIQKYCIDKGLIETMNEKRKELNLTPRSSSLYANRFDNTDIIAKIEDGMTYEEMKKAYGISVKNNSLNEYIQTSPALYAKYTEKQNAIRIERNGGLKINKQRTF